MTVGDAEKRAHGMNTLSMILKKVDRKICSKSHGKLILLCVYCLRYNNVLSL